MEFVSEKNYVYIKISILRVDWLPYARHLPHCCGKPSITAYGKQCARTTCKRGTMLIYKIAHATAQNYTQCRRRKNQRMTQVKMFIHFRLTQHVSGVIMSNVRRQTEQNRVWCQRGCAGCGSVQSGHELSALRECRTRLYTVCLLTMGIMMPETC